MYIEQLKEIFSPPSENIVEVCKQITLPFLYFISSRLVTFHKIIDALMQVSDIFYFTVSFKFINFIFQKFLLLFLKCLIA